MTEDMTAAAMVMVREEAQSAWAEVLQRPGVADHRLSEDDWRSAESMFVAGYAEAVRRLMEEPGMRDRLLGRPQAEAPQ